MTLNVSQKIGMVGGGLAGLFVNVWGTLALDDALSHYHWESEGWEEDCPEQTSSLKLAAILTTLLPLTIATGAYLGLCGASKASLTKRQAGNFMNGLHRQLFEFFGVPAPKRNTENNGSSLGCDPYKNL
jgi:hypothetical protein